jgi:hypothetical protein
VKKIVFFLRGPVLATHYKAFTLKAVFSTAQKRVLSNCVIMCLHRLIAARLAMWHYDRTAPLLSLAV